MKIQIRPEQYPTLFTYPLPMIEKAVEQLQKKYPDMTEEQCLLNLEIDMAQIDQQMS